MALKNTSNKPIGVIGAGSFGTAIANILAAKNQTVMLYVRSDEKASKAEKERSSAGQSLESNVRITKDIGEIGELCDLIFPMVPSENFRNMMQRLSPYLKPYHILIHGTKGFDLVSKGEIEELTREHVKTMSEVIQEESSVVRVGCLAGPNLAREIADGKPAATVVASQFDEVVKNGQRLLKSDRFLIYGNSDLIGIELCGILKNIIALGAGTVSGMGLGENAKALFISRGLVEMVHIGKAMGGNVQAFLGLAGVGDLMATCSSDFSRNFTVGRLLAQGMTIEKIMEEMEETAEGVRTIEIIRKLANHYGIRCPITETLYRVIHGQTTVLEAHNYLMKFPFRAEIDFLD